MERIEFFKKSIVVISSISVLSGCAALSEFQHTGVVSPENDKIQVNLLAIKQQGKKDCGAACLATVMNHWGENVSQQDIKKKLGATPKKGYTLGALQTVAQEYGFVAYVFSADLDEVRRQCQLGRPCIVLLKIGNERIHSVVMYNVTNNPLEAGKSQILVMDPAIGRSSIIPSDIFLPRWNSLGCPVLLVAKEQKGGEK